ncbi:Autolysin [Tetrabaena socialis]|uniref:Autolysin n=1 Tax=Tetrabaena socialis TaxID=47790 RepID=A0A2J7ZSU4_9CHLO|nr:Autolysin [Tetrabaena socialis]|eukprot:PNH03344.1 Autolysin [Tetrabaena socialis]
MCSSIQKEKGGPAMPRPLDFGGEVPDLVMGDMVTLDVLVPASAVSDGGDKRLRELNLPPWALRARFFNRGSLRATTMERMHATCGFNKLLLPEALSAVLPLEELPCSGSRPDDSKPSSIITYDFANACSNNELDTLRYFAKQLATGKHAKLVTWSKLTRIVMIVHASSLPACPWPGLGNTGCTINDLCTSWLKVDSEVDQPTMFQLWIPVAEMMHNTGLYHSERLQSDGIAVPWGEAADPMGGGVVESKVADGIVCTNAPQAWKAGWAAPIEVNMTALTLGNVTTYTLPSLALSGGVGAMLRVVMYNDGLAFDSKPRLQRALFVSYRARTPAPGFDSGLPLVWDQRAFLHQGRHHPAARLAAAAVASDAGLAAAAAASDAGLAATAAVSDAGLAALPSITSTAARLADARIADASVAPILVAHSAGAAGLTTSVCIITAHSAGAAGLTTSVCIITAHSAGAAGLTTSVCIITAHSAGAAGLTTSVCIITAHSAGAAGLTTAVCIITAHSAGAAGLTTSVCIITAHSAGAAGLTTSVCIVAAQSAGAAGLTPTTTTTTCFTAAARIATGRAGRPIIADGGSSDAAARNGAHKRCPAATDASSGSLGSCPAARRRATAGSCLVACSCHTAGSCFVAGSCRTAGSCLVAGSCGGSD